MGSTSLNFFLVALAVWRVSSLFAREDGPFDLFLRFRILLGAKFDQNSEEVGTNWISKGILCLLCNSIWFSALGALVISQSLVWYFINLLALSALAVLIDNMATK